jgi:hypothetical protein
MKHSMLPALAASTLAASLLPGVKPLLADSLNITYFTIAETDKDANHLAGSCALRMPKELPLNAKKSGQAKRPDRSEDAVSFKFLLLQSW